MCLTTAPFGQTSGIDQKEKLHQRHVHRSNWNNHRSSRVPDYPIQSLCHIPETCCPVIKVFDIGSSPCLFLCLGGRLLKKIRPRWPGFIIFPADSFNLVSCNVRSRLINKSVRLRVGYPPLFFSSRSPNLCMYYVCMCYVCTTMYVCATTYQTRADQHLAGLASQMVVLPTCERT